VAIDDIAQGSVDDILDATAQAAAAVSPAHGLCPIWLGIRSITPNNTAGVRFGSLADIGGRISRVRLSPKSGHRQHRHKCPLCAISGLLPIGVGRL
jgi:hypothetical protein